jgi:cytolysin-activating lysine-acyltransferase
MSGPDERATKPGGAAGDRAAAQLARDVPDAVDKTVAAILGEIVWLMSQSADYKQYLIADLEWLAMPPILLRQFRMFYHEGRPIAAVLYAFVSDEVEKHLEAGAPTLRAQDWKSGERAWIVKVIAPFRQAEAFANETRDTVLMGRDVKVQTVPLKRDA